MYILISNLLSESILTFGSGQTENMQILVFAYFQFNHFPKSKIDSESRFEMRTSILFFVMIFEQYFLKVKKIDFSLYFQKVIEPG